MLPFLILASLLGVSLGRSMDTEVPGGFDVTEIPQLVMLTFDDAVNQINFPFYKEIFLGKYKNPSKCNIAATFFVSHDYNNYAQLNQLWNYGNEVAVHTISHESNLDMWRSAPYQRWKEDAVGMREYIAKFAMIPEGEIKGFRAPFLQTSGDQTFAMLKNESFLYDSSMATRRHTGLDDEDRPIWPYTLDSPFRMDCVIAPCPSPKTTYPGLWVVPLVSWYKDRELSPNVIMKVPCAMADACVLFPKTEEETYEYFMENFNRHYRKNKAPFPVFLHESWLMGEDRRKGYMKFLNHLIGLDDVFLVSVQEVINFIKDPKPTSQYREQRCLDAPVTSKCKNRYCYYETTKLEGSRSFFTCTDCPDEFPWPTFS